jgi:MurNAc alpha-1-phosphate uridylyltransferase
VGERDLAWLYLVKNPAHHLEGDFALANFSITNHGEPRYTFSGIGVYRPELFDTVTAGESAKLAPILREFADKGKIGGEVYRGDWTDVGTIERLEQLNAPLKAGS